MADQPSILFVDDEDSIRLTLPPLLQSYGFEVTSAATVAEALGLISKHKFDVLISDLNIGHPGDGFTVVSAMRTHQPDALRFILTAYPAFESALAGCGKTSSVISFDRGRVRRSVFQGTEVTAVTFDRVQYRVIKIANSGVRF